MKLRQMFYTQIERRTFHTACDARTRNAGVRGRGRADDAEILLEQSEDGREDRRHRRLGRRSHGRIRQGRRSALGAAGENENLTHPQQSRGFI